MKSSSALGRWALHDAEVGFAELVRRARQDGPQRVVVQGRDEVVVLSAEDFSRLEGADALRTEAARQAALLRDAPEEAEALRFIEDVASWPDR